MNMCRHCRLFTSHCFAWQYLLLPVWLPVRSEVFAWSTTSRLGWSNSWLRTKACSSRAWGARKMQPSKLTNVSNTYQTPKQWSMVKRCPKSHLSIYSPWNSWIPPTLVWDGDRWPFSAHRQAFDVSNWMHSICASCAAGCLRKNEHLWNLSIAFLHSDSASAMYQTSQPIGDDSAIQCLESHRASWYLLSTSSKVQLLLDVTGWATWLASKFWMSECYAWPDVWTFG